MPLKKLPPFANTNAKLNSLASDFILEIEGGEVAKGQINSRWTRLESIYRNQPDATGTTVIEDFPAEHIPLVQPKIDRIIDSYIGALRQSKSMVTVIPMDTAQRGAANELQRGLNAIAEVCKIPRAVRKVTQDSCVAGIGFYYAPFDPKEGFSFHSIHPNDIIITPASYVEIKNAILVGPRYYRTISEINEKQENGEYFGKPGSITAGDSPDEYASGRDTNFDKTSAEVTSTSSNQSGGKENDSDPRGVEVRLGWWYKNLDNTECKWWQVLVAVKQQVMLDIEPWPYSRPPLFDQRAWDEPIKFWPATSIAQSLQGLQIKYTEAINLFMAGSWYAAIPPTIITGGQLEKGVTQFKVGGIYQQKQGPPIQAQVIPCAFNGDTFPSIINKIEQIADAVSGVSANGSGQALPGDTTATEATILAGNQDARLKAYINHFCYALEEIFEYIYEVCQHHKLTMRNAYPFLTDKFFEALGTPCRFEVTGKNPANLPQQLLQNAELAITLAQDPESRIKKDVLTKILIDASNFNSNETLYWTEEEWQQKQEQAQQMMQMQAMAAGQEGGGQ